MIELSFTPEAIVELRFQRFYHPHPRVQRKMEVLLLKASGVAHHKIADIVGIYENTVRDYLKEYEQGGIEQLKKVHFYRPVSELLSKTDDIKDYFETHHPTTIKQAAVEIEKITGIKRGRTQTAKFLKAIGLKRRKTGAIPAKADVEAQEAFKTNQLEPKLNEAKNEQRVVYFVDAAHFVFAPFLGFLWCFTRLFVKAPSGRQRFNVLGALNAITHELITVTNDAYINSKSVCALLQMLAQKNIGKTITIVLDNARYQRCALVCELADSLNIELLFLPPYSPNLNLIERMWKFTKTHCLNSKFYADFESFSNAISNFIATAHITHEHELKSLISLRFQNFGKMKIAFTS